MPATTDGIATWEEDIRLSRNRFLESGGITTEAGPEESPAWDKIYNALLDMGVNSQSGASQDGDRPNGTAISAALNWISLHRKLYPVAPPTCVIPEPSGGIIIERRKRCRDGRDCLHELTFYNNGSAESTIYVDGRIISMNPMPVNPSGLVG